MFSLRRPSAPSAKEIEELKKAEATARAEAEARAKTEEAIRLNQEVNKRLRARSGEGTERPTETERERRPSNEKAIPAAKFTTTFLTAKEDYNGINRRGSVTSGEADKINLLVKERAAAQSERRKSRSREQQEFAKKAANSADSPSAAPASALREIVDISPADSPKSVTAAAPAPSQAASGEKKKPTKWLSARDRLAEMVREAEDAKTAAYATGAPQDDEPESFKRSAQQAGAARAAAKLAGGVFYTREENKEMMSKMKDLNKKYQASEARNHTLEARVAKFAEALRAFGIEPTSNTSSPIFSRRRDMSPEMMVAAALRCSEGKGSPLAGRTLRSGGSSSALFKTDDMPTGTPMLAVHVNR